MEVPPRNRLEQYCRKTFDALPTVDSEPQPNGSWVTTVMMPDGRVFIGPACFVRKAAERAACEVAIREIHSLKLYLVDGPSRVTKVDGKVIFIGENKELSIVTRVANIYYTLGKHLDNWLKTYSEIVFVSKDIELFFHIPNVRHMKTLEREN